MEPIENVSCESSFFRDEKVEAVDLLEECWFFNNLLNIKPRMPRCHSDPFPSTGLISHSDFMGKESTSKPLNNDAFVHHTKIQRAPSMPPFRLREEEEQDDKIGSSSTRSKLVSQPSDPVVFEAASKPHSAQMKAQHKIDCNRRKKKLLRTPSLPPSLGREEKFQVTDARTSRSHKQPSTPSNIDILPPRQTSKQFRSSGEKKSIKEEALDSLKALSSTSIEDKGPPSPGQALLGGLTAGIIALILYKFATTIEASLNRQTISDNYSVRQITITIRTIVNGLTYLATFVFGLNSLGLFLYAGQLAIKSITGDSTEKETERKSTDQSNLSNSAVESPTDNSELSSMKEEQSSNDIN